MSKKLGRAKRQYADDVSSGIDKRNPYQHDYDRIIYSSALRRLAEVTQIFNPTEGVIFHNRLTHTIKVSQIARRLSQTLKKNDLYKKKFPFYKMGGLDENVVATASLAHDLGNPPFGHAAEDELDNLLLEFSQKDRVAVDGFEGNAQSFRIVTTLACHGDPHIGMNLTRAVLNALLKYPYQRSHSDNRKFGVYTSDISSFNFARENVRAFKNKKCLEAAIMDISDDITYGIHDLLDLIRSDLINFQVYNEQIKFISSILEENPKEILKALNTPFFVELKNLVDILKEVKEEWAPEWKNDDTTYIIRRVIKFFHFYGRFLLIGQYRGTRYQKLILKNYERFLITRFMTKASLTSGDDYDKPFIYLEETAAEDLIILKAITKNYILQSRRLHKQQHGERRIIREIFYAYYDAINNSKLRIILPPRCQEELEINGIKNSKNPLAYRILGDAISSLTDSEAVSTFAVLTGVQPGSIFDRLST